MQNKKKMILKMIRSVLCVFLFVSPGVEGNVEEKVIKQRESVNIVCEKEYSTTLFWLRQKENGVGFEYIGSYSRSKKIGKGVDENFEVTEKSFKVKSFERQKDSGIYGCVFINNNELYFSGVTKLRGEPVPTTVKPKVQTAPVQTVAVTTNPGPTCGQNAKGLPAGKSENLDGLLGCELRIFISLIAGCGILLLLLLITIFYCNHIRTRRCPHHYKRQHRSRPAGHKTLPNPPDY